MDNYTTDDMLARIAELEAQIAEFPPGHIVTRDAGEDVYHYHHYRKAGKTKTVFLPPIEATILNEQIQQRKKLEKERKALEKALNLDAGKKRSQAWPLSLVSDVLGKNMFPKDLAPIDLVASVEYALSFLNSTHVDVVRGYYQKGLCLSDIARSLEGISKTRAAQIRTEALCRLRKGHLFLVLKYGVQGAVSFGFVDAFEMVYKQAHDPNCPRYSEKSSIDVLGLSDRIYNSLWRARIYSIQDILEMPWSELLKVRNMGISAISELDCALARCGFTKEPLPVPLQTLQKKNIC